MDNYGEFHIEHVMRRADGSNFTAEHASREIRDDDGQRLLAINVIRDITQRKATENQLRQSQKMEAVGQLTGGVAHDFNNLLGVIIGNLDIVAETLAKDDPLRSSVEAATKATLSGAALNRQLLAFSRQQPLSPKIIDLDEHVSSMTDMLRRTLPGRKLL